MIRKYDLIAYYWSKATYEIKQVQSIFGWKKWNFCSEDWGLSIFILLKLNRLSAEWAVLALLHTEHLFQALLMEDVELAALELDNFIFILESLQANWAFWGDLCKLDVTVLSFLDEILRNGRTFGFGQSDVLSSSDSFSHFINWDSRGEVSESDHNEN